MKTRHAAKRVTKQIDLRVDNIRAAGGELKDAGWELEDAGESSHLHGDVYGQEEAIEQLRLLLLSTPSQAIILSAPNNAGKTHVFASALSKHTTVVFVSLSRFPLTTVSNLVQTVTAQLGIKKLSMKKMLTDLLPFAGRELLMKERQTVGDLEEPRAQHSRLPHIKGRAPRSTSACVRWYLRWHIPPRRLALLSRGSRGHSGMAATLDRY